MSDTNQFGIDYAKGATFIGDSTTRAGRWCAIMFSTSSIVDELVSLNWDGSTLSGQSFDPGTTLYGVFTSIKLQNGHCVAYKL